MFVFPFISSQYSPILLLFVYLIMIESLFDYNT